MLWPSVLFILIFTSGAFCDNDECQYDRCHTANLELPTVFPETVEELRNFCEIFQEFGNCVTDVMNTCGEDESERNFADKLFGFADSACQEDNHIFKTISSNLECMAPLAKKMGWFCTKDFNEKHSQMLDELISPFYEEEYRPDLVQCFHALVEVSCKSIRFGTRCGDEVGQAVREITEKTSPFHECTAELVQELEPIYDAFQAILQKEIELENTLQNRK